MLGMAVDLWGRFGGAALRGEMPANSHAQFKRARAFSALSTDRVSSILFDAQLLDWGRRPVQLEMPGDRRAMGSESIYQAELRRRGARWELTLEGRLHLPSGPEPLAGFPRLTQDAYLDQRNGSDNRQPRS